MMKELLDSLVTLGTNSDMARKLDFSRPAIIYEFANKKPIFLLNRIE